MEGKDISEELQLKALEPVRIKINNKWLLLSAEFVASHPGGSVIYQYRLELIHFYSRHENHVVFLLNLSTVKHSISNLRPHIFSDSDATQIFDAFHEGSTIAYKQLKTAEKRNRIEFPGTDPTLKEGVSTKELNVGVYDVSIEQVNISYRI
jgi:hypothetical protein